MLSCVIFRKSDKKIRYMMSKRLPNKSQLQNMERTLASLIQYKLTFTPAQ